MKKGILFGFATAVALTFSGCGGGSSSGDTSSGGTCENLAGSVTFTETFDYSQCLGITYSLAQSYTATISQSGCTITVSYSGSSNTGSGSVSGSTATFSGTASVSTVNEAYTISATKSGTSFSGSGSSTLTDTSTSKTCVVPRTISGTYN